MSKQTHKKEKEKESEFNPHKIEIYKFPRTHHIVNLGAATRDDLILDEKDANVFFQSHPITIEEKVDGANLGISMTKDYQILFQNRSHYVTVETSEQFKGLDKWVLENTAIYEVLSSPNIILFGEWCHLKHTCHYTQLPSAFLAFDIFDNSTKKFYSVEKRDAILKNAGIATVPKIAHGIFSKEEILHIIKTQPSSLYQGPMEGVYIRLDVGDELKHRGKIVREEFLGIGEVKHWSKNEPIKNIVMY